MKQIKKTVLFLALLPLVLLAVIPACDDSSSSPVLVNFEPPFDNAPCESSDISNEEYLMLYLQTQESLLGKVYAELGDPPMGEYTFDGVVGGSCYYNGGYSGVTTAYAAYQDFADGGDIADYDGILTGTSTTSIQLTAFGVSGTTTGTITMNVVDEVDNSGTDIDPDNEYPGTVELHLKVGLSGPTGGYYIVTQEGCESNGFYHNDL